MLRAEKAASFRDSEAPGREVAFSPDGRWLATSGDDGVVALWKLGTGRGPA